MDEPTIGQNGWYLISTTWAGQPPKGSMAVHHEDGCKGQQGRWKVRPASDEELDRDGNFICLTCLRRLAAKARPKPTTTGIPARENDPRDYADRLRDHADIDAWLKGRQAQRAYQRQVRKALDRGEVAEGE
jgi:hypothetical protein